MSLITAKIVNVTDHSNEIRATGTSTVLSRFCCNY
uniref:Uncharacterized protein n=1 Tax=Anguilla anguilla TaxID=7936 RepID=A0A0E9V3H3_ANGAN